MTKLEDMYAQGWKKGNSRVADEAIFGLYRLTLEQNHSGGDYESRWADFVEAITKTFPDISPLNLIYATDPLMLRGDDRKLLFVRRIMVLLIPQSDEQITMLGHTYQKLSRYRDACESYTRAYNIVKVANPPNFSPRWMDAISYLCYRAECECRSGLPEQALATLVEATALARKVSSSVSLTQIKQVHKIVVTTLELEIAPPSL